MHSIWRARLFRHCSRCLEAGFFGGGRVKFRYRWVMLILYAISPILVHGTELGRPDHQSLLILLVAIAICAGWSSQTLQPANIRRAPGGSRALPPGRGDLGFGLRAACALSDSDGTAL
jgi:hypothetical protein